MADDKERMLAEPGGKRMYNIDALRIFSMLFVCYLHVGGGYGGLAQAENMIDKALILYGLSFADVGVNCFMMITGYVSSLDKWKCGSYINLWSQVAFYCVGIGVAAAAVSWFQTGNGCISSGQLLKWYLPVPFAGAYWYFIVYSSIFFLSPFILMMLESMNQKWRLLALLVGIGMLSLFAPLGGRTWGYSTPWLVCMYMLGWYLRRHPLKLGRKWMLAGAAGCAAGTALFLTVAIQLGKYGVRIPYDPVDYTAPFVVLESLFLFSFFAKTSVQGKLVCKTIGMLVPVSFGVYLIHCHPASECYFRVLYGWITDGMGHTFIAVVCASCVIYLLTSCIDSIRLFLFRILKVRAWSMRAGAACEQLANRAAKWLVRRFG